jgi:cardiolipin synthase A/B
MGRALTGKSSPRRRPHLIVRRALLAVAVLVASSLLIAAVGPQPPTVERIPALAVADPGFARTLQAHLGAPVVAGNRVDLLLNGDEIFPAKLGAILAARQSINYAEYFWAEGAVAQQMADALAERCRAGVRVNVLLDGVGTLAMPGEHVDTMRRASCRVETFRPLGRWSVRGHNNRNHRRILVVDGRVGITGGSGVSEKWTGDGRREGHWRDTDVRVEGPVVEWLQAAFVENWREATRELLGGADYFPAPRLGGDDVRVQVIPSSPGGSYAAYTMVLLALTSARQSILLTNPYFVLDDPMTEALLAATRRGVRVVALTPGKIDHNLVRSASRHDFGRLLQGGVQIFEYQAALLHAKTLVIDGAWASVGSTNLDNRSFALNDELNVALYDRSVAGRLQEVFERDLADARRVTYDDWAHRGLTTRLQELLVRPVRDLL